HILRLSGKWRRRLYCGAAPGYSRRVWRRPAHLDRQRESHAAGVWHRPRAAAVALVLLRCWIHQRKPSIRIALLAQRHWIDSYKHLKQRIDVCAEEVSSARLSIGHREHAMHVHRWLAVELRDVADQRCNLHLLINRNDPVHLLLRVEPSEASIAKCADAGEV